MKPKDLQELYPFIGYIIRRKNDNIIGLEMYDNTIKYADNIIVVDYDDKQFMGSFYHMYNVNLYDELTKLPALVVIDLDAIKYAEDENSKDIIEILYDSDILSKYAIFNNSDITTVYVKFPSTKTSSAKNKIIQYMEDNNDRIVSTGFKDMSKK